jgi:hypothetical protein
LYGYLTVWQSVRVHQMVNLTVVLHLLVHLTIPDVLSQIRQLDTIDDFRLSFSFEDRYFHVHLIVLSI